MVHGFESRITFESRYIPMQFYQNLHNKFFTSTLVAVSQGR